MRKFKQKSPASKSPLTMCQQGRAGEGRGRSAQREWSEAERQTACFSGHRILEPQLLPALRALLDKTLEELWQQGYRRFICGCALGFDLLAGEAVVRFKETHAGTKLILAIPCASQTAKWPPYECQRYAQLLCLADETTVLSRKYYAGCMQVRNCYMVNQSSACVCYLRQLRGGTLFTVNYALDQGLRVINLAMSLEA